MPRKAVRGRATSTGCLEHVDGKGVASRGQLMSLEEPLPRCHPAGTRPVRPGADLPRPGVGERKPGPALLPLLLLLLAGLGLGGCQHSIRPPAAVSDPVRVFVIDYGRHASLALPKADSGLVEWSWGDWNWYALERTGPVQGLQALFASPRSTLSRRELAPAEGGEELAARVGAAEVLAFDVERERARALQRDLEARWLRRRDLAVRHSSGRVFVPDDARYGLFNNSVHELTRWLEALGADVSGAGVTANFRLREP